MSTAKELVVKVIDATAARRIVERFHYSGKCTQNSQIHFGVFLNGQLEGALQFGPSIDKRRMAQNLGIGFNEALELNRMAFSDALPKNSESRAIGICLRMLRKAYPHLRVIISFADACQCGDGTIYRASGFKLHSYKKNNSLLDAGSGKVDFNHGTKKRQLVVAKKSLDNKQGAGGKYLSSELKLKPLPGFQMKYLFFFDKALEGRFKFVDKIPDEVRMYKGQRLGSVESGTSPVQGEGSGESPTPRLQSDQIEGTAGGSESLAPDNSSNLDDVTNK